ncbi:pyrophosphohydrolase domain-containing protein [Deinococcus sp. UYEF24]
MTASSFLDVQSNAGRVAEFHRAIGKALPTVPAVPDAAELTFRLTLLAEEVAEVHEAAEQLSARLPQAAPANLVPLAHELTDLLYVTYGALQALGIDADVAFAEVHRVNMHKATGPRRADGKQLKPPGWQPADLKRVLGLEQGGMTEAGKPNETVGR